MTAILTVSGRVLDFTAPDPDVLAIEDIARGLSNTCRFAGQCEQFYSVAQHSLHVSEIVSDDFALEALLHDATEGFAHDVTSPLKRLLPDYRVIEQRLDAAVRERFGLPPMMSAQVAHADAIMLSTEWRDVKRRDRRVLGHAAPPPLDIVIRPWTPEVAFILFMSRFEELMNRRGGVN